MIKIPAKDTTRLYELTYLLPASLTEAEVEAVKTDLAAQVKKVKGKVVEVNDWGKKPMAYQIKKHKVAHREAKYVHVIVEMPAEGAATLNRAMHLNNQVIRHLLVLAEETSPAEEAVSQEQESESAAA